jgi:CubicO group peptidase (beta-lactamase class C family)
MTKTMSNALIGNLVKHGLADISKPAPVPAWSGDDRKNITLNNLLQMSSGLDWEENYGKLSSVTRMLYLEPDMVAFSLQPPLRSAPDEEWVYSSGTSNILSGIIRSSLPSDEAYFAFPYDSLYDAIGMKSAVLETDAAGNYVFSSYCWATARDWTRFGLLYLNKGNWLGKPVFTEEWADYSTTPAKAANKRYSAQIWLNAADNPDMKTAPPDAYYEDGFGGQRVLIIPSRDLVIVMLSGQQKDFEFDYILPELLSCFKN